MSVLWLIPPLWVATSILAFRVMLGDYQRSFRVTTRGDVTFIAFMAALGPVVLPLLAVIVAGDRPSKFFSKKVKVKSERTGA